MTKKAVKALLDQEVIKRNVLDELSEDKPDPLMVAKLHNDENIALICALFAYGNAKLIVKFLNTLDFELLKQDDATIKQSLQSFYYRFQNSDDIAALFMAIKRLTKIRSLKEVFLEGYQKNNDILEGVFSLIEALQKANPYESRGYRFLIGKPHQNSPYKRWLMFVRWMVRSDDLDMGLWYEVRTQDLLLPLDTHTFKVGQKLGLLKRKSYDLKAVQEITRSLSRFDKNDPVKYDFALYRLGQEGYIY